MVDHRKVTEVTHPKIKSGTRPLRKSEAILVRLAMGGPECYLRSRRPPPGQGPPTRSEKPIEPVTQKFFSKRIFGYPEVIDEGAEGRAGEGGIMY